MKVIDKARGMNEEGALKLLEYHKELRETKIRRLERQLEETKAEIAEIDEEMLLIINIKSMREQNGDR